jgi:hypothetical protein
LLYAGFSAESKAIPLSGAGLRAGLEGVAGNVMQIKVLSWTGVSVASTAPATEGRP